LAKSFEGCDIAGFNSSRFDIPMLDQEFQRAGVKFDFTKPRFIDVQTIFHKKEQRNLVAAYKFYCDKDLTEAHSASADTRATYEVLKAQLDRYEDLPNDMEALAEFSCQNRNVDLAGRIIYNDQKQEVINFGKYKGRLVSEVLAQDPGYYGWIMQGDFPQNTKDVFTNIKLRSK
jgi:DNA polymerase-3 subunit epsilon